MSFKRGELNVATDPGTRVAADAVTYLIEGAMQEVVLILVLAPRLLKTCRSFEPLSPTPLGNMAVGRFSLDAEIIFL